MTQLTVYEEHQAALAGVKSRHRLELKALKDALKKKQAICDHKYGPVQPEMFYALGETAPGKKCTECGVEHHAEMPR